MLVEASLDAQFTAKCPPSVTEALLPRKTQINGLEIIAVWLAVVAFSNRIRGRRLVIFIDNSAALFIIRKGASRSPDLNSMAALILDMLDSLNCDTSVVWVPSSLNCADGPSRSALWPRAAAVQPRARWESLKHAISSSA